MFQVNFEEFKNGLVVVLSHSLDFSTSEDDSSYLVPGETLQGPIVSGSGSGPARLLPPLLFLLQPSLRR